MDSVNQLLNNALEKIRNAMAGMPSSEATHAGVQTNTGQEEGTLVLQSNAENQVPLNTPYNLIQQPSSHNSYNPATHDLNIAEQFAQFGIHSFELDIHSGDPGINKFPFIDGDVRPDGDYNVYHFTGDSDSHYPLLSDGLDEIRGLDNTLPVTLFIDLKHSPFEHQGQEIAVFEELLQQELGDKLFTPQDIIDRVPGATTLQEAIDRGGWPTAEELEGRVLVVLTGNNEELFDYTGEGADANNRNAFIAPAPSITTGPEWFIELDNNEVDIGPDQTVLNPYPEAIFYNMPENNADNASIVHDSGYVSRVYGFDDVGESTQGTDANHLGTDHIDPSQNEWEETINQNVNTIDPPPTPDIVDGPII